MAIFINTRYIKRLGNLEYINLPPAPIFKKIISFKYMFSICIYIYIYLHIINIYCNTVIVWVAPVNTDFGAPLLKIKNPGVTTNRNKPSSHFKVDFPTSKYSNQMLTKLPLHNAHSHQTNNHSGPINHISPT